MTRDLNKFFCSSTRKLAFPYRCIWEKHFFSPLMQKTPVRSWAIKKKAPNRSLHYVIYVRFGPFFFFHTIGGNILFLVSGQKTFIFWTVATKVPRNFSLQPQKNFIRPSAINKECPKSQFTTLGFASEGNLRAIWAIIYFSGHEP